MPHENGPDVALFYDDDAHNERDVVRKPGDGLFGRHVANSEFLAAWLDHGRWQRVVGVVSNPQSAQSLAARFAGHPSLRQAGRVADIVALGAFHERFFPDPPASVFHLPHPMDPEFSWARQHKAPHSIALSGVTHTISLKGVMERFRELVTGPFEEYDTLFCISDAVVSVVRAVTDNYAHYLRERDGGQPRSRVHLARVPFGIDTERLRPASFDERASARQALGIAEGELCVLFVGRLSYYSKVHPFPMYRAIAEAARRTASKVHLVLAGWADSPSILQKFRQAAEVLAPNVKVTFVDGMALENRSRVWRAADIFTSLSDNIQETLGLTVLEAQSCGLPVVVTDWNGCRDSVAAGESGYLVSTRMITGATTDATSRHLMGETNYGEFLGEISQSVAVDTLEATAAFEQLFKDAALRERMGSAARTRALALYSWPRIIEQYQAVWAEQEQVRRGYAAMAPQSTARTPLVFPEIDYSFAAYPTEFLHGASRLVASDEAEQHLGMLLSLPIASYLPRYRITDAGTLRRVLKAASEAPCSLASLEALLASEPSVRRRRATLAWLLKYDLLRAEVLHASG